MSQRCPVKTHQSLWRYALKAVHLAKNPFQTARSPHWITTCQGIHMNTFYSVLHHSNQTWFSYTCAKQHPLCMSWPILIFYCSYRMPRAEDEWYVHKQPGRLKTPKTTCLSSIYCQLGFAPSCLLSNRSFQFSDSTIRSYCLFFL